MPGTYNGIQEIVSEIISQAELQTCRIILCGKQFRIVQMLLCDRTSRQMHEN